MTIAAYGARVRASHLWKRLGLILLAALALAAGSVLLLLALVERGYADRWIARAASHALGRQVTFDRFQAHLLTSQPDIRVRGLRIGNPAWLRGGDLVEIGALRVRLLLWPLLRGHFAATSVEVDRPALHLFRLGPRRNNWAFSQGHGGPAFGPLRDVAQVRITRGRLDFRDVPRALVFHGDFAHDSAAPAPFRIAGAGMLKGGPIRLAAIGGALNGSRVGQPYPFMARLVDGATIIRARGTSGDAFNLSTYALNVSARGPNLADIGYVFNLITPNTAPFVASTKASSDGTHLRFDDLDVATGASRILGRIWSDHSTDRREIRAAFTSPVLARQDINAILAPVPPRALASTRSGAVPAGVPSRWLISDSPISLRRLRGADFDFTVRIDRLTGYALPLSAIRTRIDLDHGLLDFPSFRAQVYGGTLQGSASADARAGQPILRARLALAGIDVARIGGTGRGRLDARLALVGTGDSLHAAAAASQGSFSLGVRDAVIPRRAGWLLGGDLLRAALAGGKGDMPLTCAEADFSGRSGRLVVDRLGLGTALGAASGTGYIDLGSESLSIRLQGTPARRRLFQVATPVAITGPWLAPTISVLPGHNAHALGLRGMVGVALTPLAGLLPLGKAPAMPAGCPR